jgi:hypothetical protein
LLDDAAVAAANAVEQAEASGNPSTTAYALWVHALAVAATDPAAAAALIDRAHSTAALVGNQWLLNLQAPQLAMSTDAGGQHEDHLASCLEAMDTLHRTGWVTHAWIVASTAVEVLFDLGRKEEAALLLGGCKASGIASNRVHELPLELAELNTGHGDRRLMDLFTAGSRLALPQLIRIAAGQQLLPAGRRVEDAVAPPADTRSLD